MTFAAPLALFGLVAAAIPVLLHLVQKKDPPLKKFPAVRYLVDATRDHQRKLRLRNLFLLLIRTALIIALVLAAAGPVAQRSVPFGVHPPSATVLVVDNSASSSSVLDGVATYDRLAESARSVLEKATPADRVWLLLADGVARPGTISEQLDRLDRLEPTSTRFDLGAAVEQASALVAATGRPGEVVVFTDAQRTAFAPASGEVPVLVLSPEGDAPNNRSIDMLDAGPQPWGAEGGRLGVSVNSPDSVPVAVSLVVGQQPGRDVLLTPGLPGMERIRGGQPGWGVVSARVPPDELRLDDVREVAVRVAPPVGVFWDPTDRFLSAALEVLVSEGRVTPGGEVNLGGIGSGASIVFPPEDPAQLGALNRALDARGSDWRYGSVVAVQSRTDSAALLPEAVNVDRRVTLIPNAPDLDVLVTVAGEPWLVRVGNIVLLGSRFEPDWTELPGKAAFVPLLDQLVTRIVHGAPALSLARVGEPLILPSRTTAIATGSGSTSRVEGGSRWSADRAGVYWLLDGTDTLGAVSAILDPRESLLERADEEAIKSVWPNARVASVDNASAAAFAIGGKGDLRPLLLLLSLVLLISESIVATRKK